ncbi:phosphatase PAP2 family protein [Candidatus Micrarchaeota archaeon]|nr:phosphatase PAP2 family protein [Candidatus Micrarchaeota archaeon]
MDIVTEFISKISIEPLTKLAVFLDHWYNSYILFFLMTLAIIPFFNDKRKVIVLAVALFLVTVVFLATKNLTNVERPCVQLPAKVECPNEPAFPSGHTSGAFVFIAASIGEAFFIVYFILGIFVAFSRIYVGVHWFNDIAGGMVVGVVCYVVADRLFDVSIRLYERHLKKV